MSHLQMMDAIEEIADFDPTSTLNALGPSIRLACRICAMDGDALARMAKRLDADEESGLAILAEIEDARRALNLVSGPTDYAELPLLAAFSVSYGTFSNLGPELGPTLAQNRVPLNYQRHT